MVNSRATSTGTEKSNTPITDSSESGATVGTRFFGTSFVIPSTHKFYIVTAIEVKNGTAVNGNVTVGASIVDADPPTVTETQDVCISQSTVQTGTGTVQKIAVLSNLIPSGTRISAWLTASTVTTSKYRYVVVSSENINKGLTDYATCIVKGTSSVSWTASTEEFYLKIYYRGVA